MRRSGAWVALLAVIAAGPAAAAASGQEPAGAKDAAPGAAPGRAYEAAPRPTRLLAAESGLMIRMLLERKTLGGDELELGEVTFPVGYGAEARPHRHGAVEVFYVLSGTLLHEVDGVTHRLEPGAVGVVRPGDSIIHGVSGATPVRALVIWAPAGEADRVASFLEERPIGPIE